MSHPVNNNHPILGFSKCPITTIVLSIQYEVSLLEGYFARSQDLQMGICFGAASTFDGMMFFYILAVEMSLQYTLSTRINNTNADADRRQTRCQAPGPQIVRHGELRSGSCDCPTGGKCLTLPD
ncbi:hypothetical protein BJX76DRAFT_329043 [Aspergillus varians]